MSSLPSLLSLACLVFLFPLISSSVSPACSSCRASEICAGTLLDLRCVSPVARGEPCGTSPFSVCHPGSACKNGYCRTPKCHKCAPGKVCVGPKDDKRCVMPMPKGKPCGTDPFWVCEKGLKCKNGYCRTPKCHKCAPGKVCVGPKDDKRCVMPMPKGKPCGTDPFWVCEEGLKCKNGYCRTPKCHTCTPGKVCVGPKDDKRCVMPMPKGKPCGTDPFWVCEEGLKCKNGYCRTPKCHKCAPGKVCVGPKDDKRCVMPMPKGKSCGKDPFWVCEEGLKCKNGYCRTPKCHKCAPGKVCVGPKDDKRCVMPMPKGKPCGTDPFWVCDEGLKCKNNVCRSPKCDKCTPGKVCVGPKDDKRCVMPMPNGKPCGKDPFWVCEHGLKCKSGFCRTPKCHKCAPGKVCGGPKDDKRCVMPMTKGKPCGSDPFWVCEKWLVCLEGTCRLPGGV